MVRPSHRFGCSADCCRKGDAFRGPSASGQYTGQKGEAESSREAIGGGAALGLFAEETGAESCWYQVSCPCFDASSKLTGSLRAKKPKKGMDYNADIPFEKQPAPGFYDVNEENAKVYAAPVGSSLRALEGKRKQEIEEMEEKNKRRKGEDGKPKSNQTAQFVAAREAQIKKLKEQEQIIRRRKLNLPTPQVGEQELEEIVKIGQAGEMARGLVGESGNEATGRLLGDYEGLERAKMARTPRTEPVRKGTA